jgi:hypothetical protein
MLKSHNLTLESYDRSSDPREHIEYCIGVWKDTQLPSQFWVYQFFHYLGSNMKYWYVHEETRRHTAC